MEKLTTYEIYNAAYYHFLDLWVHAHDRVEALQRGGKCSEIAERKEQELWEKLEELHDILLDMEKRRLGDEK